MVICAMVLTNVVISESALFSEVVAFSVFARPAAMLAGTIWKVGVIVFNL